MPRQNPKSVGRPYRSHKVPACDQCRKRKTSCKVLELGQACTLCQAKQLLCITSSMTSSVLPKVANRERSGRQSQKPSDWFNKLEHDLNHNRGTLIVSPAVAEDVLILEDHLAISQEPQQTSKAAKMYQTMCAIPKDPILYLHVPRRREGLQIANDPGRAQWEVMEQILGSSQDELLSLFFKFIHPYFPVLDKDAFMDSWKGADKCLSPALLCEIFAFSLTLWQRSEILAQRPCPNIAYAANQAVTALQEEFMAPSTSTISAALIDLVGRPTKSTTGNILTMGRTVALAYSFGLNRDPSLWPFTLEEKNFRIRLWWCVFIHDFWSSYAHGTPPIISAERHDVPLPVFPSATEDQKSFNQLCRLTQILSEILPLVYSLKVDHASANSILKKAERALAEHETAMKFVLSIQPEFEIPSGHCSLWLCYLSLRVLLQRLFLKLVDSRDSSSEISEQHFRMRSLRDTLIISVDFIISLKPNHFQEFWLPHISYFIATNAILLLRCMIETRDVQESKRCRSKLVGLHLALQTARSKFDWDIANVCLERCGEAFSRFTSDCKEMDTVQNQHLDHPTEVDQSSQALMSALSRGTIVQPFGNISGPSDWDSYFLTEYLDLSGYG